MKEGLELIFETTCDHGTEGLSYYRETVTNIVYLKTYYTCSPMLDPTTGLPLTYKRFMELKQKK